MQKRQIKRFVHRMRKEGAGYLFILPQFLLFAGLMIYPIISGFVMSLYKITLNKRIYVGFQNYTKLFSDKIFMHSVYNTVIFVVSIVALSVIFGIFVSWVIFDRKPGLISFIRSCFYIPVVVSIVVMSVIWKFMFSTSNGLINYLLSVCNLGSINFLGDASLVMPIIIFVTFVSTVGQVIVMYVAAMIGIPNDLFEAAEIDGSSRWQQLKYIILPLVRPTTVYVLVTQTIAIMKIFSVVQLLTNGGPNHASETMMFYLYQKAFENTTTMGQAAAVGVLMFLVCVVISVFQLLLINRPRRRSERRL